MKYGLKDGAINAIISVLATFTEVDSAVIYGSRAKGNFKPQSDIDLTLKGDRITHTILNKIRWALDDLLLPVTFDVSIHSNIQNDELLDHIKRVGKLFYNKGLTKTTDH